jgi:hypothetical protein
MNANNKIVTGHCLCQGNSFSIDATKIRFGFASCHCSICRQSHSAPFVMWAGMNADCSTPDIFKVSSQNGSSLSSFRTSNGCTRYFCSTCGSHLYIRYDDVVQGEPEESSSKPQWAGEVHFPTALLDDESVLNLEEVVSEAGRPRYLHVFSSDRHPCMGDLNKWADAPKYGGKTGLEPMN